MWMSSYAKRLGEEYRPSEGKKESNEYAED